MNILVEQELVSLTTALFFFLIKSICRLFQEDLLEYSVSCSLPHTIWNYFDSITSIGNLLTYKFNTICYPSCQLCKSILYGDDNLMIDFFSSQ